MSYNIFITAGKSSYQVVGNNECPDELIEELKKQGCQFYDGNCFKKFEIKDIQGIFDALNKYLFRIYKERKENGVNIFDFEKDMVALLEDDKCLNKTFALKNISNDWYMNLSVRLMDFLLKKKKIELAVNDDGIYIFRIKDKCRLYIRGC